MKKSDCFAMNGFGKCAALNRTFCAESDKECPFYKTMEQAEVEKIKYGRQEPYEQQEPEDEELTDFDGVTTFEAAKISGMSVAQILRYVNEGKIDGVNRKRRWCISRESAQELAKYVERQKKHKAVKGVENIQDDELYTIGDIARIAGVRKTAVESWIRTGAVSLAESKLNFKQVRGGEFVKFLREQKRRKDEYLTIRDVMELLGESERTVRGMIYSGAIKAEMYRGVYYIPKTDKRIMARRRNQV